MNTISIENLSMEQIKELVVEYKAKSSAPQGQTVYKSPILDDQPQKAVAT